MDDLGLSVNYLDIFIVIPLLWFGYKGFKNGFVIEAASLAALLLGVFGAYRFSGITSEFLIQNMNIQSEYMSLISFAITFIVIVVLVHFFAKLLSKLIKAVALGFINKLAGLVFGVAKLAFILSILLGLFNRFDHEQKLIKPNMKSESFFYKPLSEFAPMIFPYLNLEDFKIIEDKARQNII